MKIVPQNKRAADDIDRYVGMRLMQRREELGMGQQRLAEFLGISFQQVQKYERGANRVSASRLHTLARVLSVAPAYFFEGTENLVADKEASIPAGTDQSPSALALLGRNKDALKLLRAFDGIKSDKQKRKIVEMAELLARSAEA
jgi:transcriptional regulator with XRE-family HTH domain